MIAAVPSIAAQLRKLSPHWNGNTNAPMETQNKAFARRMRKPQNLPAVGLSPPKPCFGHAFRQAQRERMSPVCPEEFDIMAPVIINDTILRDGEQPPESRSARRKASTSRAAWTPLGVPELEVGILRWATRSATASAPWQRSGLKAQRWSGAACMLPDIAAGRARRTIHRHLSIPADRHLASRCGATATGCRSPSTATCGRRATWASGSASFEASRADTWDFPRSRGRGRRTAGAERLRADTPACSIPRHHESGSPPRAPPPTSPSRCMPTTIWAWLPPTPLVAIRRRHPRTPR